MQNKVTVTIDGQEYTLVASEDASYMKKVAAHVDSKIAELREGGKISGADAAVLAAGTCGFGMGATPNAMANMQALTDRFVPSVKAYILVPIVGSMFADFINSLTITFFINLH